MPRLFGLIGRTLSHSFSKGYFTAKFEREGHSNYRYELFELADISQLPELIDREPDLVGLNVTMPYKVEVLPYLDVLDGPAAKAGAVNCIKIERSQPPSHFGEGRGGARLTGYNTDIIGFRDSLSPWLTRLGRFGGGPALVLGNGGAARAVIVGLEELGFTLEVAARRPEPHQHRFTQLAGRMHRYSVIVNATPLGMSPNPSTYPPIPYQELTPDQAVYDVVYNPEPTRFMELCAAQGCPTLGGKAMLHGQAEAAWRIWNSK